MAVMAGTRAPAYAGVDVFEAVGAGVALGAGAGGVGGGAIVGFGFGADDGAGAAWLGAAAGRELWLAAGTAVPGWVAVFDLAE
jgi:hypothetical protein